MRIVRLIGVAIGIISLLGIGFASLSRAQQANDTTVASSQPRGELRERVLKLRTDVDLLQIEVDSVRATLMEVLKKSGERAPGGEADRAEIRSELERLQWAVVLFPGEIDEGRINKMIQERKPSDGAKMTDEEINLIKDLLKGSDTAKEALVQLELKGRSEISRLAITNQKNEFARMARILNEAKLDLAIAENRYLREAR